MGRDLSALRKDGTEVAVEIGLVPLTKGAEVAVLATIVDISERRRAHDRQQMLTRELQHRTQNLLTVIQSIASRSFVDGKPATEAATEFNGRLQALSAAFHALARGEWVGALLVDVLRQEATAFAHHIDIAGCELIVNAQAAQNFALIFHELATNAVKHGALTVAHGKVSVRGRIEPGAGQGVFIFSWTESGGPAVTEPASKGFGSFILENLADQFADKVTQTYDPQGLRYELHVALSAIESTTPAIKAADPAQ
jgi:two-component sensor histidine kinase